MIENIILKWCVIRVIMLSVLGQMKNKKFHATIKKDLNAIINICIGKILFFPYLIKNK